MDVTQEIINILRSLGSIKASRGRCRTAAAIAMAYENEDRLAAVIKEIYQVVAERFGCKWTAVERNVRTVAKRAWDLKKAQLVEIAGYAVDGPPTAGEFIEIISSHIRRKRAAHIQG